MIILVNAQINLIPLMKYLMNYLLNQLLNQ